LGNRQLEVMCRSFGLKKFHSHADAIAKGPDGKKYFVEPWAEKMTMKELLSRLEKESSSQSEVFYLQSQNGNLFNNSDDDMSESEFEPLLQDIPESIEWATEAFGDPPEAVNIWIGNGASVTSVHSDPFENLYTVVRGQKHFTLFPPTEGWCLQERTYPHATYTRENSESQLRITPSSSPPVRWSSVQDPTDEVSLRPEANPLHISLSAGDTLYLPVGWWHHVRQTGLTIALNWWYDFEIRGTNFVWLNFLRGETEDLPDGNEE